MIFIHRSEAPETLEDAPKKGDYYNKPAVVHALWEMQRGKCCYCERKLPAKGHLKAVEHFAPKAIFKGLRNEWTNLLLACSQCNGEKSDNFPVVLSDGKNEDKVLYLTKKVDAPAAIIDPSSINPEEHVAYDFTGSFLTYGLIMAREKSLLGSETIDTVGLHSPFYTSLRFNYYTKVVNLHHVNLVQAIHDDESEAGIQAAKTAFENLMAPQSEFAGFVRAYARHMRLHEKPIELNIPPGPPTGV